MSGEARLPGSFDQALQAWLGPSGRRWADMVLAGSLYGGRFGEAQVEVVLPYAETRRALGV